MRIACVVGTYPQPSETFIAREVEGLRARGHVVELFSLFRPDAGTAAGVTYGWIGPTARLWRKLAPGPAVQALAARWDAAYATRQIDVVMAHFGSLPSTVARLAAGSRPFVLSLHARDLYVEAEALAEKVDRAAAVVTCTRANVDYLRAQFPAAAARIHLVYHGLPPLWLAAPLPERVPPAGGPLRVLAVGRLVPKKGFDVLVAACGVLRDRGVAVEATIAGAGPEQGALTAQCRQLRLTDRVRLTGWQSQRAVAEACAAADVFCCPSRITPDGDRDGLPNTLLEAMSTGLPAVGSAISGIPEAITDGVTGLLVPPNQPKALADALARCLDPGLRAQLGAAAALRMRAEFPQARGLDVLEGVLAAATIL